MLDLLLLITVKRGFGFAFYLVCGLVLVGVYICTVLIIDRTSE
jgi:hypothetical protein